MKHTVSSIAGLVVTLWLVVGQLACAAPVSLQAMRSQDSHCPSLAPSLGNTVIVNTEADLRSQAYNAAPGTSILIEPGTYNLQSYVHIRYDKIALRSTTGNRDDVILDFGGMSGGHFGILVEGDGVTIADLTIRNANDHGVSIQGTDQPVLYNLHILDIGDQLVKVNPAGDGGSDDGLLACSRLEYTTAAPNEYTNGISAHNAHDWVVRDNEWYRIRTPGNTPVPAILFWSGSSGTIVERNLLVDCAQGIAFGNASHGEGDHIDGIVRNNIILATLPHDSVIEMVHASGWLVAHNTALLLDPAPGLTWGMEARFDDSQGTFAYNLTNLSIWPDREGALGTTTGNVTTAAADWFADAAAGDLHLQATATGAIDQAAVLAQVSDDFDGQARPAGAASDVGADEYAAPFVATNWIYLPLVLKNWSSPLARPTATPQPTISPPGQRLQPDDLVYRGAFRLPDTGGPDEHSWKWSNWDSALTYVPGGDPGGPADGHPGSLFGTGHDWNQWVSEVNIPPPVISTGKNLNDLNTASTIQEFSNIRDGIFDAMEMPRVGLAYLPAQSEQISDKLYFAWAPHLDEGATNPSHGWSQLDLSDPQTAGAWRIDDLWNYVTGDYLFDIPAGWAERYLSGRTLATGRYRDGGQGAQGPSLYAIAPWAEGNPPAAGATLPATTLLRYTSVTDGEQHTLDSYHHADEWTGGAWLTAGDSAAVLFAGTKGLGDCWYGCADGTDQPPWPDDCERGWWSSQFAAQLLFYDPADLASVAQGQADSWQPQPYASLDIDQVLYHITSDQQKHHVGAIAFDRGQSLLYVLEPLADDDKPLVHVWHVEP